MPYYLYCVWTPPSVSVHMGGCHTRSARAPRRHHLWRQGLRVATEAALGQQAGLQALRVPRWPGKALQAPVLDKAVA